MITMETSCGLKMDGLMMMDGLKLTMQQLEMALQEAMAFDAAWEMRTEASIAPVVREKSVRLLSTAPESESNSTSMGVCTSCETEIDDDLPFCPACGENL